MISFVGAGPGAPDLITLRGARLLGQADVVVYAGSLVNPELLELCREGVEVYDSSSMTLGEISDVMIAAANNGKEVIRLATGDVSVFGALSEMVRPLDEAGIEYQVVPGVSSVFAAAAALPVEYTHPGVSQTLIVTRAEGRTPVPVTEHLSDLAQHKATMAILLSAGLVDKVEADLLAGGLDPATPAAFVVRATWPDERVYRCTVDSLVSVAETYHIERTAIILVGDALAATGGTSLLYDAGFSHGYRKGHEGEGGA